MNSSLHDKLIAAARNTPPDDRVPYAFEKRIMAQLAGQTAADPWGLWSRGLSRAAIYCVIFMLILSASSFFVPSVNQDSLSQAVDQTLFAAIDNTPDNPAN
ncbi:MAG TPA: hypothetical protein VH413_11125 [Verrucomicrobiae bacterium]|jgi:hypothetical protein|nr:hypothetical protein [Verrucomicrobiae bacterium]